MQGKYELPCVPLAQQAFFFVHEAHRHQMARRYEDSAKRATKRLIRYETGLREKVTVEMLDGPLFTSRGQMAFEVFTRDPLESDTSELLVGVDEFACTEAEKKECIEWIADRAHSFIGYVIDRALEALASSGNAKEKQHILEWMFAADIYGREIISDENGEHERTVFCAEVPMTFQWCCKLFGLHLDVFQEHVLVALKQAEAHTRVRESRGEVKPGRSKAFADALNLAQAF